MVVVEAIDLFSDSVGGTLSPLAAEQAAYPNLPPGVAVFVVCDSLAGVLAEAPGAVLLPANRVDPASWTLLSHMLASDHHLERNAKRWLSTIPERARVAWEATH